MKTEKLERFKKQLDFITELDKVKKIIRQTLLLDQSKQENDAEHSWHMAMAIIVFQEFSNFRDLDLLKTIKMALIHDVVEIDAGDTFAYDSKGNADKFEREKISAARIYGLLPDEMGMELKELWLEFEKGETPEAKFAGAIDKFMPMLHNYKTKGKQWQKHGVTAQMVENRNKPMIEGSVFLWDRIMELVNDAVAKGYLKE
ncbi:HD domain-containing protein [Plebeiibacterium marinum]|uniref:HD domain-containing protein n=1 Tax=Plebeiibacterium marinum TaxID=2992111 RepID=A0AAE3MCN9_9BACT|nr:HD domain-containing protein [Plebeiobacterium marinum]MCW3805094.1 HD domain-containing protein [Plebeiobacterium marinum]